MGGSEIILFFVVVAILFGSKQLAGSRAAEIRGTALRTAAAFFLTVLVALAFGFSLQALLQSWLR